MKDHDALLALRQSALSRIESISPGRRKYIESHFPIGWTVILNEFADTLAGAAAVFMKEKWGRLDITIDPGPGQNARAVQDIEGAIEDRTEETCMLTGAPGRLQRCSASGWAQTLSDEAVRALAAMSTPERQNMLFPEFNPPTDTFPGPG